MRPVRIDLAKRALRTAFLQVFAIASVTVPVIWTNSRNAPRKARPYVALRLLTPPLRVGTFKDESRRRLAPTSVTGVVSPFAAGDTIWARINGIKVSIDAVGGDTQDSIRDAFVTQFTALLAPDSVSVAADAPTGGFVVTPGTPGAVHSATGNGTVFSPTGEVFVEDLVGRRRMSVSCTIYTEGKGNVEDEAARFSDLLYTAIDLEVVQAVMRDSRVGVRTISEPILPFSVEGGGARIESQASFDLDLTMASLVTSTLDQIDTVEVILFNQAAEILA